jgi:hypothetical protein
MSLPTPLPDAVLPELDNEPVFEYRMSYRRFRSGHYEGETLR